jgi:hypothetical protein
MSAPGTKPTTEPRLVGLTASDLDEQIVTLMRAAALARVGVTPAWHSPLAGRTQAAVAAATEQEIRADLAPLVAEQLRRAWSRYFIPTRGTARVHVIRDCLTLKRDAAVVTLLWQASGMTPAEMVAILGPVLCQHCHPVSLGGRRRGIRRTQAVELLSAAAARLPT